MFEGLSAIVAEVFRRKTATARAVARTGPDRLFHERLAMQNTFDGLTLISEEWVRNNPAEAVAALKVLIMRDMGCVHYNSEAVAEASTIPMIFDEDRKQGVKTVRVLAQTERAMQRQKGDDQTSETAQADTKGSEGCGG